MRCKYKARRKKCILFFTLSIYSSTKLSQAKFSIFICYWRWPKFSLHMEDYLIISCRSSSIGTSVPGPGCILCSFVVTISWFFTPRSPGLFSYTRMICELSQRLHKDYESSVYQELLFNPSPLTNIWQRLMSYQRDFNRSKF